MVASAASGTYKIARGNLDGLWKMGADARLKDSNYLGMAGLRPGQTPGGIIVGYDRLDGGPLSPLGKAQFEAFTAGYENRRQFSIPREVTIVDVDSLLPPK